MNKLPFMPYRRDRLDVSNRIVSLPTYVAYADENHEVNDLLLHYYDEIGASGVGMAVVENVTVEACGLGNLRTMLVSEDWFLPGLARLARTMKRHDARATPIRAPSTAGIDHQAVSTVVTIERSARVPA